MKGGEEIWNLKEWKRQSTSRILFLFLLLDVVVGAVLDGAGAPVAKLRLVANAYVSRRARGYSPCLLNEKGGKDVEDEKRRRNRKK